MAARGESAASAACALLLLVPAPSLGAWLALHGDVGAVGRAAFALSKVWILVLPLVWWRWVLGHGGWPRPARLRGGHVALGLAVGLPMATAIVAAWLASPSAWFDVGAMRAEAAAAGLGSQAVYVVGLLYWCLINSLLEEYVWRWFVRRRCEVWLGRKGVWPALLQGVLFTVHHVVALTAWVGLPVTVLGSLGVFVAGTIWAVLASRCGTVWPAWIAHVCADLPLFVIGDLLLFG